MPNCLDTISNTLDKAASVPVVSFLTPLYVKPSMSRLAASTVVFIWSIEVWSKFIVFTNSWGPIISDSLAVKSASSSCCINASVSASIVASNDVVSPIGASRETVSRLPSFLYWFITSPLALYITDWPAPPATPVNQPNKLSFEIL